MIQYLRPGQVRLTGRLSARFQGNRKYLHNIYDTRAEWMLEPFRHRGEDWVLEPRRSAKQELNWAGEYAGKWLDAAAVTAAGDTDEALSQHTAGFAAALAAAQEDTGYLGIETPARREQEWDIWNVKYSMTGLLTQYEVAQDEACLKAAARAGEWLLERYGQVTGPDHPFFNSPSEGGVSTDIIDQLVRLYRHTGDHKFLDFVSSVIASFGYARQMRETGKAPLTHVYMLTSYLGGIVEFALAAGREDELPWIETVWEELTARHLYPTGSLGYREHLREAVPNDAPVSDGEPDKHHQETCATVEWLMFNARLLQATGGARYAQAMEHTIYNALLAAQSGDGLQWMYYTPLRYEKRWFTGPTSCCYWSGPRGIAHLPEWVYASEDDGLRVNLYESSEASLTMGGRTVAVSQTSRYPDAGHVALRLQPDGPLNFTVRLRALLASVDQVAVTLNGRALPSELDADGYYSIRRTWSPGDELALEFEIPVEVKRFLNENYGVLVRGPEVLAADQRDNPALDLDRVSLRNGLVLRRAGADTDSKRRRYAGEAMVDGRPATVVFTPYADCGGEGARFRTAFPVLGG